MISNTLRCRSLRVPFRIVLTASLFLVLFSLFWIPKLLSPPNVQGSKRSFPLIAPTNRKFNSLPDFRNGGVIVFYHIYKTGGSTVGKLLHELARHDQEKHPLPNGKNVESYADAMESDSRLFFTMIRKKVDWEQDCLKSLELAEKKMLVLLELHVEFPAPDFPTLVELAPMLDRWRAEAHRRGVGFFAFSLLREPVSHALSFFNFFHVGNNWGKSTPTQHKHDSWNPFRPLSSTEENLLHSYFANNRQCRMLNSDPQSTRGAPTDLVWSRQKRSQEDIDELNKPCPVDKVYDSYFGSLDWVGTTEKLQNETLPLLTKLVANDPSIGRKNNPFKVYDDNPYGVVGLKKYNLSDSSMNTILERTDGDRALYAEVTRNFKLTDLGWDYQSPMDD